MTSTTPTPKSRFLVLHDYGMGGARWWIHARSAREVLETFAEVEVVDSPEAIERAAGDLDEVDIDEPAMPPGLDELRAKRDAQRGRPGFGALADRSIVHLRRRWDGDGDEPATYFMEVGSDDWPFNHQLWTSLTLSGRTRKSTRTSSRQHGSEHGTPTASDEESTPPRSMAGTDPIA
jgi:hypothetical protein